LSSLRVRSFHFGDKKPSLSCFLVGQFKCVRKQAGDSWLKFGGTSKPETFPRFQNDFYQFRNKVVYEPRSCRGTVSTHQHYLSPPNVAIKPMRASASLSAAVFVQCRRVSGLRMWNCCASKKTNPRAYEMPPSCWPLAFCIR